MTHAVQKTMSLILIFLFFVSTFLLLPDSAKALTEKKIQPKTKTLAQDTFKQLLQKKEKSFVSAPNKTYMQDLVKAYYQGDSIQKKLREYRLGLC